MFVICSHIVCEYCVNSLLIHLSPRHKNKLRFGAGLTIWPRPGLKGTPLETSGPTYWRGVGEWMLAKDLVFKLKLK